MNNQDPPSIRRFFLRLAVVACLLLAVASVIPTFIGPEVAKEWFTSLAGGIAWCVLALLILLSIVFLRQIHRRLGLLAMHAGMILVVAGALWGSDMAHDIRSQITGNKKIPQGYLAIPERQSSNVLFAGNPTVISLPPSYLDMVEAMPEHEVPFAFQRLDKDLLAIGPIRGKLPFDVYLKDFAIEYYPDGLWQTGARNKLGVGGEDSLKEVFWKIGTPAALPFDDIDMLVTDYKLLQYGPTGSAVVLPEITLQLTRGQRTIEKTIQPDPRLGQHQIDLTELYDSEDHWLERGQPELYFLRPFPDVKDYKSDLVVSDGEGELARKVIEVNQPLHVAGYHLYQIDYDQEAGRYTALLAVSDDGLILVYAGFILIAGGLAWHVVSRRRKPAKREGV